MEDPSGHIRKLTLDLWLSYCDTLRTAGEHRNPKQYIDRIHEIYEPLFTVRDPTSLGEHLQALDGFRQILPAIHKADIEGTLQTFELVSTQLCKVLKCLDSRSQAHIPTPTGHTHSATEQPTVQTPERTSSRSDTNATTTNPLQLDIPAYLMVVPGPYLDWDECCATIDAHYTRLFTDRVHKNVHFTEQAGASAGTSTPLSSVPDNSSRHATKKRKVLVHTSQSM